MELPFESPAKGNLAQARDLTIVEYVGMGEIKLKAFNAKPVVGRRVSLGIEGLGACSVIILASDHAAIVAHIGPNRMGSLDLDSSERLARTKMNELERLYHDNQDLFGPGSHAYVVFSALGGVPRLPEQTKIYRDRLSQLGIPIVADRAYETPEKAQITPDGYIGTLWVVKKQGDRWPTVYLQDQIVHPTNIQPASQQAQTVAPAAGSSHPRSQPAAALQTDPVQPQLRRAAPSQAGPSAQPRPPATTSAGPSQSPLRSTEPSYWTRQEGSNECVLRSQSGTVLQRLSAPPRHLRVYVYDQNGRYVGVDVFDGQKWTRQQSGR